MNIYEEQFAAENDFPERDAVDLHYIICSTPRCGSHLLGHSLFQTGQLGFPLEYFNPVNFVEWRRRFETNGIEDTLTRLKRIRTSPNGVFGCKLHFDHFETVANGSNFETLFPNAKFVFIQRKDLLSQAVSLAKAQGTGAWISKQVAVREAEYRRDSIDRALRKITRDNACWDYLLSSRDWPLLRVFYEDFVDEPKEVLGRIAHFLEVDLPSSQALDEIDLPQKQRNETNNAFKTKYIEETTQRRVGAELEFLHEMDHFSPQRIVSFGVRELCRKLKKVLPSK